MSSPEPDLAPLFTSSGGEDAMESEDLHLLDDSLSTEQDLKVAEGESEMDVAPTDKLELVPEAMVEEVSLQEKVSETGNKDTGKVEEETENDDEYEPANHYLTQNDDSLFPLVTIALSNRHKSRLQTKKLP